MMKGIYQRVDCRVCESNPENVEEQLRWRGKFLKYNKHESLLVFRKNSLKNDGRR